MSPMTALFAGRPTGGPYVGYALHYWYIRRGEALPRPQADHGRPLQGLCAALLVQP